MGGSWHIGVEGQDEGGDRQLRARGSRLREAQSPPPRAPRLRVSRRHIPSNARVRSVGNNPSISDQG